MAESRMNPKVDEYLGKAEKWREEFIKLRTIILECELNEELKWGVPCYTLDGKNVVLIHGFKEYCAILFIKGALLRDPQGILVQQTENVQAGRQIRFTNVQQIEAMETTLKAYIHEAIEVEKAGLEVEFNKDIEYKIPDELQKKFDEAPDLKTAFEKDAGAATSVHPLLFRTQTIQNTGGKGGKIHGANPQGQRIKR